MAVLGVGKRMRYLCLIHVAPPGPDQHAAAKHLHADDGAVGGARVGLHALQVLV